MKFIRSGLLVLMVLFSSVLSAQSFYEIEWESGGIDYTALVVYYDHSTIDVRVKYFSDSIYTVAKYDCEGSYEYDDDGTKYFIFDGENADVVYQSRESYVGYSADNFIFTNLNEDNQFEELYTIDDASLELPNYVDYIHLASFKKLDPETDFDQQYIYNFFEKDEPEYELFLSLANGYEPSYIDDYDSDVNEDVTLYLVMVAATNDRVIGSSTEKDMYDIEATFQKIAKELEIEMVAKKIYGDEFDREHITGAIDEIDNSSNDIVIFYYSGHGYNDVSSSSGFPTMDLDGPDYLLEDAYNRILNKGARLTLVFGDLCNSIPMTRNATRNQGEIPFKSAYLFDVGKLKSLFIEAEGSLISTSSRKGQWSYCMTNPNGTLGNGHFTHAFIESLIKAASRVSTSESDWQAIVSNAYSAARSETADKLNQDKSYGQSGYGRINLN